MANPWLRLWVDMPNDPKWRTIARISGQPISLVISIYIHMLVCASNATERGRTQGWNNEDIATALDVSEQSINDVINAMQCRVLDGDYLTGWDKRQPKREDGGAERARNWRESQKRTQPNATERKETLEERRGEEIRLDTDTTYVASDADDMATVGKTIRPDCPHQKIIDLYHEVLPMCPRVRDWTPARAAQLRARWNEDIARQNLGYWQGFFEYVSQSDFLCGRVAAKSNGAKPFCVDLEWITKSGNFVKIREGKYHE